MQFSDFKILLLKIISQCPAYENRDIADIWINEDMKQMNMLYLRDFYAKMFTLEDKGTVKGNW